MVDYSRWNNIEVSDDEDDIRPNVDKALLFRWRHQARLQRMEDRKKELEEHGKKKSEHYKNLNDAKNKLIEARSTSGLDVEDLEVAVADLEKEGLKINKEELELQKKGKKTPWNVDTMSHEGFSKTFINKKEPKRNDEYLTDESDAVFERFIKDHEKELKHFGILKHYGLSWEFLNSHKQLISKDAANYLVIWCLNLEIEKKHEFMEFMAHQTFCLQHILELSQRLNWYFKPCAEIISSRISTLPAEFKASFINELQLFKERIRKRALEKIEEVFNEVKTEYRSCIAAGVLHPNDVFESIPENMKKRFQLKCIRLFQETMSKMPEEQTLYHMICCIDSKLWIPRDEIADENESAASGSSIPSK